MKNGGKPKARASGEMAPENALRVGCCVFQSSEEGMPMDEGPDFDEK
jgi:hypothetical protein